MEVEHALADIGIGEGFKRHLISRLRGVGFDAGGRYEYTDVKVKGDINMWYIVEVNLTAEFEVGTPVADHATKLEVSVGRTYELRKIMKLMCGAV
ncbi:hypothetical protein LINPERPRIM_LOCUS23018 [Linum perenne]